MNKTNIKSFAVWARRKLISEITYKAGLMGMNENGILDPLPISRDNVQFFDIGTGKPTEISDREIQQRNGLIRRIREKESTSDYKTAFQFVVEEVAYTWFNRLVAIRFMEVNDYLPSRVRVLSSEIQEKAEPDMVTNPFDTDMEFTPYERDRIVQLKDENKLDELFRMLFIKQCNKLNEVLPELFENTHDYTEFLLTISFTDKDGIVSHLMKDIDEEDFTEAVEIIGWLYQYYNTEPKDQVFKLLKKNVKITKERIPAATQLFTPDWIVRYMVENSLGRIFVESKVRSLELRVESLEFNEEERINKEKEVADKMDWKYYLPEVIQTPKVRKQLNSKLLKSNSNFNIQDIKIIDPCMGSGHILVYAFDVLMQVYESQGYTQRDAAQAIIENNLYGLDIDDRAYQLAYFAIMMKARKYDRRFLTRGISPKLYSIQESNTLNVRSLKWSDDCKDTFEYLVDTFKDAKEYGSILNIEQKNYDELLSALDDFDKHHEITIENRFIEAKLPLIRNLINQAKVMAEKYDVVVTNPPYMGSKGMSFKLSEYVKKKYFNSKSDLGTIFIERCVDLCKTNKYISLISMHTWMHTITYEKLRVTLLNKISIQNMVHLGKRAFEEISGEVVQTTAFTMLNTNIDISGKYVDLTEYNDAKEKEKEFYNFKNTYISSKNVFFSLPGYPISYYVNSRDVEIINKNSMLEKYAVSRPGLQTSDNDRFLKVWFEIAFSKIGIGLPRDMALNSNFKWFPHNKGGGNRRWYGNIEYVINFHNNGEELKFWVENNPKDPSTKHWSRNLRNYDYYLKSGLTWSSMSQSSFATRMNGEGFFFDTSGPMIFGNKLEYICAFTNSKVFLKYNKIFSRTLSTSSNSVSKVPLVLQTNKEDYIRKLVKDNVSISKTDWDSFETSWDFMTHPLVNEVSNVKHTEHTQNDSTLHFKLSSLFKNWELECNNRFNQLKANEEELNRIFIDIYQLQDELTPEVEDKNVTVRKADLQRDIKSFISYAVGCMLGRYSLDIESLVFAGGEWDDNKYTTFIPGKDNCIPITDEEYFKDDIVGLFVAFVKKVYGEQTLEENLDFIAKALGNKGNTSREIIRNYFIKDFFKDHVKVYQKRPIYWLYDSGKQNGFKALIYMHRYSADTTGLVRVDYLHKMQRIYLSEIERMQEIIDNSSQAREIAQAEKRKEKLVKQLKETKEYDEKIAHIALSRIEIDLDDGVKVNYEKVQTGQDGKKLNILTKI